jgi:hypothetical protein
MGNQGPLAEPEPLSMEEHLDLEDKELFQKAWGLKAERLSDEDILLAIELGHF